MRASSAAASCGSRCASSRPRHQRLLRVLQFGGGPAVAEQRLVGLQAVQAHPFEKAARLLGLLLRQRRKAQGQVGAVAQATLFFVARGGAADLVEQRAALGRIAALDQRDAEIEARVGHAARAWLDTLARQVDTAEGGQHLHCTGVVGQRRSASWPAAARVLLPVRRARVCRCGRARPSRPPDSRAGSESWPGRTRPGRAPGAAHPSR